MTASYYKMPLHIMARKDLSAYAKLLYAVLDYRQGRNNCSWAGIRRLAKDVGCSPTTVAQCSKQLEEVGLLVVARGALNKKGKPRSNNRYTVERTKNQTVNIPETECSIVSNAPENEQQHIKNRTELKKRKKEKNTPTPTVVGLFPPTVAADTRPNNCAKPPKSNGRPNAWALWVAVWCEERPGQPDPANLGPNTKAAKQLGTLVPDQSELENIYRRYLQDKDPFLVKQGHALRLLPARIDAYRGQSSDPDDQDKAFWEQREAELQASGEADDCREFLKQHPAHTAEGLNT